MKQFFLLTFILLSCVSVKAKHIIGGTISYEVKSVNGNTSTLKVTASMYRDGNSTGARFDSPARFGIYGAIGTQGYQFIREEFASVEKVSTIDFGVDQECIFPTINIEMAVYRFYVNIPNNVYTDITIAYQRCCYGSLPTNILEPSETGIAITAEITSAGLQRLGRIETFLDSFPVRSLTDEARVYNVAIADASTMITYELVDALAAGGQDGVNFGDPTVCTGILPDPEDCPPPFAMVTYLQSATSDYGFPGTVTLSEDGELIIDIETISYNLVNMRATHHQDGVILARVYQQFVHAVAPCVPYVEEEDDSPFRIYPNPTLDEITFSNVAMDVSIIDMQGRLCISIPMISKEEKVDVSGLSSGMYIVSGTDVQGTSIQRKIIVAR